MPSKLRHENCIAQEPRELMAPAGGDGSLIVHHAHARAHLHIAYTSPANSARARGSVDNNVAGVCRCGGDLSLAGREVELRVNFGRRS